MTSALARPTCFRMTRSFGLAPSADDIERLARAAMDRLPAPFATHLHDIVLLIEEFANDETLADLGIEDPFDLSGVYEGVPLTERSIEHSGTLPDRIRLFRAAILDEWIASASEGGGTTLEHLVTHILVHEVGHHFGLSDEDMHALEDMAQDPA